MEDLAQMKDASIEQLQAACDQNSECAGFNSDGWLKKSLASVAPSICDLYIKKSDPQPTPPPVSIWPLPQSIQYGNVSTVVLTQPLTLSAPNPSADLTAGFERFTSLVFTRVANPKGASGASLSKQSQQLLDDLFSSSSGSSHVLKVTIADVNVPLALGVDESYTLTIPNDGSSIQLTAKTVYGAYHGFQTLSQLIQWSFDTKTYIIPGAPITIQDAPKFPWRGLLIDTSRHFEPILSIYRTIEAMTYAKMNTLHMHLVDQQSWPIETPAYPALWTAAWSPEERYTTEDLRGVVEYARQRGVRVVPEFDTPGHAASVCTGYPEACPSLACPMPLDPSKNFTFDLIAGVLSDWTGTNNNTAATAIFPDSFIHLGGDEVDTTCWQSTPSIAQWLKENNLTPDGGYEYFVSRVDTIAAAQSRSPIRWEEVWQHFGTALSKDTVVHAWLSTDTVVNATNHGYRVLWSVDPQYYLDSIDETWDEYYDIDILQGVTNTTAIPLVLGGETCMWGETVDGSDIDQTIWPRAAAAAERQWSYNMDTPSYDPSVEARLQDFRCMLLRRGIAAAPVTNPSARSAPSGPGSCKYQ